MNEELRMLNDIITETEIRIATRKRLSSQIEKINPIGDSALAVAMLIHTDMELLKSLKKKRKKIIKNIAKKGDEMGDMDD